MTKTVPDAAGPLPWGQTREMNALEALMWRAEADPRLRSTICAVEILDRMPDWDRFVAACEWATRMAPRFRQKVVDPAFGMGFPRWVVDPDFDLHYHVRRTRLPEPGSWAALFATAEQIAMTPFDRARSPWEALLIEGLPGDRAAFLLKMHHSTTDGMGGVQLFSQLHSRTREPNPAKPQPVAPPPEWVTPRDVLVRQAARDVQAIPSLLRSAGRTLRALARPDQSLRDAIRFGESLARVLADSGAPGSPLLRGRSLSWRFSALDVAFDDLRAAAKAAGGSLNDAFLAALLGGFRLYHEELGQPIEKMPIAIPISVRRKDDPEGGNRFTGARPAAPVGIADPAERIRAVSRMVRSAREEPALEGLELVAPALSRLPAPLVVQLTGGLTRSNDLQASNVPGIREEVFLAGAKIERSYGFGPLPGCATMITMISHGDRCCVGINVDPAAVTDPARFTGCVERGFREVLDLVPGARPPVRLN